jgi:UDPglucose--hexose-1-phosphate uridylyltransferase
VAFDLNQSPHRRLNQLTGEWILVSPHRTQRPWLGQLENLPQPDIPPYDPECYMCPGNQRAEGSRNPRYESTFVFDNDYPALLKETPETGNDERGLLISRTERGICRVVCFSPRHDLTVSRMAVRDLRRVVDVWTEQYEELGALPFINYVQIFENRGAMMGASNPHPHGQIWASSSVPNEPAKEHAAQRQYASATSSCLLCDYIELEKNKRERMVCDNEHFSALVPFWAIWPFETMIIPHRHLGAMPDLSSEERSGLADILKQITSTYDKLFQVSFPYSMGFHQRPNDGSANTEWHMHAHFYPPLLRSATVRKFMVGFEMLGTPQRDITAESAAQRLRELNQAGR